METDTVLTNNEAVEKPKKIQQFHILKFYCLFILIVTVKLPNMKI